MKRAKQTHAEEIANTLTHAFGIVYAIVANVMLWSASLPTGNPWVIVSFAVFGVGMLMCFSTSTIYHACRNAWKKPILRKFDHSAIFIFIAATYTPFALVTLREHGPWGWIIFGIVWAAVLIGVPISFWRIKGLSIVKTIAYIAMGWVVMIAIKPLYDVLAAQGHLAALWWLIGGGLFYTLGTVFYVMSSKPFFHAIWHLFVFGGVACHFVAVLHLI